MQMCRGFEMGPPFTRLQAKISVLSVDTKAALFFKQSGCKQIQFNPSLTVRQRSFLELVLVENTFGVTSMASGIGTFAVLVAAANGMYFPPR